jgi:hypothetical protein
MPILALVPSPELLLGSDDVVPVSLGEGVLLPLPLPLLLFGDEEVEPV